MKTGSLLLSALLLSTAPTVLSARDTDAAAGSQSSVPGPDVESRVSDADLASVPLTPDELQAQAPEGTDATALVPDEASPPKQAAAETTSALGKTVHSEETLHQAIAGNINPPALNVATGKQVIGAKGEVLGTITAVQPDVSTVQLTMPNQETVIVPQHLLSIDADGRIMAKTTSRDDIVAMARTQKGSG